MRVHVGLLVVIAAIAASATFAAEGRIPIFEQTVLDAGNGPIAGKYIVTRNILLPGGRVIDILGSGSEDVEIDLNGFVLRTGGGGLLIHAENLRTLVIRNGVADHEGFSDVIRVQDIVKLVVENMTVEGGRRGIYVDNGVIAFIVRNNTIRDTSDNGILANATGSEGATEIADGVIESNLIIGAGARGIECRWGFQSLSVRRNRVEEAGTYGITVNSTGTVSVVDNKINGAGYRGLIVNRTEACRVEGNVVKGAGALMDVDLGGDGINIGDRAKNCLVVDNVSSNNWKAGMGVDALNSHIERNVLSENGGAGLRFGAPSGSNTFGRNTARGNGTGGGSVGTCVSNPAGAGLAEPDFCDESSSPSTNTSFGDNLAPGPPQG